MARCCRGLAAGPPRCGLSRRAPVQRGHARALRQVPVAHRQVEALAAATSVVGQKRHAPGLVAQRVARLGRRVRHALRAAAVWCCCCCNRQRGQECVHRSRHAAASDKQRLRTLYLGKYGATASSEKALPRPLMSSGSIVRSIAIIASESCCGRAERGCLSMFCNRRGRCKAAAAAACWSACAHHAGKELGLVVLGQGNVHVQVAEPAGTRDAACSAASQHVQLPSLLLPPPLLLPGF